MGILRLSLSFQTPVSRDLAADPLDLTLYFFDAASYLIFVHVVLLVTVAVDEESTHDARADLYGSTPSSGVSFERAPPHRNESVFA